MKRMLWMLAALLMAGCEQSLVEERTVASESEELYAVIEDGSDSRTFLDDKLRLRWTADDRITVFRKEAYNREYRFTGVTGANAGGFEQVSVDDELYYAPDLPYTYAAYPHSSTTAFHEDGYFVLTMPAEQTYVENSVGLAANTMVAVTNTGKLMFKNAGSFLRVQLYGDGQSVKQITLSSIAGEALAGVAHITPSLTADPTCTMVGTTSSIVLNCEEAVVVNATADAPVSFWIVLPPVVLSEGYKVTVEDAEGETQEFTVNKVKTFVRNQYSTMKRELKISDSGDLEDPQPGESEDPEEPEVVIPNNEIWYTASSKISPFDSSVFGATYLADQSTYDSETQKGILKFDGTVTQVGAMAFVQCAITSVTLPSSVTSIGDHAFAMSGLTSLELPEGVQSIAIGAFSPCPSLVSVTIPNSVTSMDGSAFGNCTSLTTVTFESGITSMEGIVFSGCPALKEFKGASASSDGRCLIIGNTLYSVAGADLFNCTIPDGVTTIHKGAFQNCTSLMGVTMPNTISSVGAGAFEGCNDKGLDVRITDLAAWCRISFADKTANPLYSIGTSNLYLNETPTKELIIPNDVTIIKEYAFYGASITDLTIHANVTAIEKKSFANCRALSNIVCLPTTPPILGTDAFYYNNGAYVDVPDEVIDDYKADTAWYEQFWLYFK